MAGISTGLLCLILAGAAWTDIQEGKVRNRWLFAGVIGGILCRGWDFFPGAAAVLAGAFFLFRLRVMGAGDGKLMALIVGYLGMDSGLEAIFFGMAAGAIWSLCRLWHDKSLKIFLTHLAVCFTLGFQLKSAEGYDKRVLKNPRRTIPLAPCMAAGTYLYLMVTGAMALWSGNL